MEAVPLGGSADRQQCHVFNLGPIGCAVCLSDPQIWQVNKEHLAKGVPEQDKYEFKQVAILNWAYFVTFGSELAVVSMLPLFFLETFDSLDPVKAGLLASGFAFMNLVARPTGGWFSDYFGRRKSLLVLIGGLGLGYALLSQIDSSWWIPAAVISTIPS